MFTLNHIQGKLHLIDNVGAPEEDVICAVVVTRAYGREGIDEHGCTYDVFCWNRAEREDIQIVGSEEWASRYDAVVAHEGEEAASRWTDELWFDNHESPADPHTKAVWDLAQENIKKFKALLNLGVFSIAITV